jgi:peptidyl-tRNA hydrolase, PTH1 family
MNKNTDNTEIDWLIIGLGNPGKVYAKNRHNIGWMVASCLIEKYKKPLMTLNHSYMHSFLEIPSDEKSQIEFIQRILVAMPTTYMNNSGEAVLDLLKKYSIPLEKMVVICDEYNFPLGKLHLKLGGGDGGHNGVASVIEALESQNFIRLRCGIGRNFGEGGLVDYVLSNFKKDEINERDIMLDKAIDALEFLIKNGLNKAMSIINSGELWEPKQNGETNSSNNPTEPF